MVDATQGLTGTTTTVQVPENTSAPQVQVSQAGVSVGHSAPVNPPVDITSVTKDVLAAMKDAPPPIDIEAVAQIKTLGIPTLDAKQGDIDEDEDDGEVYRYVAIGE